MSIPALKLLNFSDQLIQRFQANLAAVLTALVGTPIVQGALATYTVPAAGLAAGAQFSLNQGLGRVPVGIIPLLLQTRATLFAIAPGTNPAPTSTVSLLTASALPAGLVLSFWVF
jgi:hypothetical protein